MSRSPFASNHPRSRTGFTLIELLVVISIIALLIGILLPALSRARYTANVLACATRLQQLGRAIATYQNDSDSFFPLAAWSPGLGGAPYNQYTWDDALGVGGYDGRPGGPRIATSFGGFSPENSFDLYTCPLDNYPVQFSSPAGSRSYGINELQLDPATRQPRVFRPGLSATIERGGTTAEVLVSLRSEDVTRSSDTIQLAERTDLAAPGIVNEVRGILGRVTSATVYGWNHTPVLNEASESISHHPGEESATPTAPPGTKFVPNYLFSDSSVQTLASSEVFEGSNNLNPDFRNSRWDAKQ